MNWFCVAMWKGYVTLHRSQNSKYKAVYSTTLCVFVYCTPQIIPHQRDGQLSVMKAIGPVNVSSRASNSWWRCWGGCAWLRVRLYVGWWCSWCWRILWFKVCRLRRSNETVVEWPWMSKVMWLGLRLSTPYMGHHRDVVAACRWYHVEQIHVCMWWGCRECEQCYDEDGQVEYEAAAW